MSARSCVFDLRQYTLVPGRRDALIELFDRYLVDGQEDVGIHVAGQFRDLDDPNRFVWLRGFDSFAARAATLQRFYNGSVWHAHRDCANATMADSDDALLLEPLHLGASYPRYGTPRSSGRADSVVAVTVAYLGGTITPDDRELADSVSTDLAAAQADVVAVLATHVADNNFPALPLRDENVLVWIARFVDDDAYARHRELLGSSAAWSDDLDRLARRCNRLPMQQLRLRPTDASHLR